MLDVPQRFDAGLSAWLAAPVAAVRRAPLQWLHQLQVQEYAQAAGTLSQLPQVRSQADKFFNVIHLHDDRQAAPEPAAASAAAMQGNDVNAVAMKCGYDDFSQD